MELWEMWRVLGNWSLQRSHKGRVCQRCDTGGFLVVERVRQERRGRLLGTRVEAASVDDLQWRMAGEASSANLDGGAGAQRSGEAAAEEAAIVEQQRWQCLGAGSVGSC